MGRETCRMPGCDKPTRTKGEPESEHSDSTVSSFGADFCSAKHELRYEDLRWDAREAQYDDERENRVNRNDLPEYDGPPY